MPKEPYLDTPGVTYLWAKVKALFSPLSSRVGTLEGTAVNTTTNLEALQAQVNLLQLKYHTDVNGTTFNVDFQDLDGLTVTGVWNEAEGRIEF